jgi:hypothetical protein
MRTAAATFILIGVFATAAMDAQGRGLGRGQGRGRQGQAAIARAQGIPPGQLPPAGQCRVWYEGVPPGRQPAPTGCNEAERVASRDADARVIYGDDRTRGAERWRDRGITNQREPRITDQRVRTGRARSVSVNTVPYNNGYRDGLEKGREDAGDRDSYDPVRHSRYRSADRGYDSRYGTKDDYKLVYRDGFEAGYEEGYRNTRR